MPQYMLKIDSNANSVLLETGERISELHKYYLPKFKTLFNQESTASLSKKKSLKKNIIKERFNLAPYTPHIA